MSSVTDLPPLSQMYKITSNFGKRSTDKQGLMEHSYYLDQMFVSDLDENHYVIGMHEQEVKKV